MSEDFVKVSDHIEECIQSLSTDSLNPSKLFTLTIQTIEYLDKEYKTFNGQQKKDLLIEASDYIEVYVKTNLETVIESVIQLSKGDFKINEKQQAMLIRCLIQLCQCVAKKHKERSEADRP